MVVIAPHNGRAEAVGLGHNGCVRHYQPLSLKSYTIVALLCVPIDVLHSDTVGKSAAQSVSAIKVLKPFLQRRIGETAVVASCKFEVTKLMHKVRIVNWRYLGIATSATRTTQ